jgi:mono/diheme cytochrome c family protein
MRPRTLFLVLILFLMPSLPACRKKRVAAKTDPILRAYDEETDPSDPQRVVPLNYQQAQGKRVFYSNCVWCHADATPAGPSNRSNLTPAPPLMNDGETFNPLSDEFLENTITLGGGAMGKSAMMPPWGRTLTRDQILEVIAYIRAVAQPPYQPPARPGLRYSAK